ncbi:DNA (cytosine-5)-methyltransferase 1 [Streptomyces sp. DvalAA-14]|uniref:DNA cytosine methyltransferase n=1 Tax=unclassified Streptomyces TaxID=2593676 RepID=UPI00081B43CC|nr:MULTISPECIES: DNA cytosine methyltransferase [unclassified Streptomyces]MYS22794.1 DNA cytosine methyltransferase [Streptomyces sp. SID4948]SCE22530.1 DNA (cytosine-5)-methyltransferase 1 [Streptomyces sp. DvalAA-14]
MAAGRFSSLEICSGMGAQALGLERAGFDPVMLIDTNDAACTTISRNRPHWDVRRLDLIDFDPAEHPETYDVDLLSGGLPRVKSAAAVRRAEDEAERGLLRAAVLLLTAVHPKALLLENVPDLIEKDAFAGDRSWITDELAHAGYSCHWKVLNAADFGVPQNRRCGFLIAFADTLDARFSWPQGDGRPAPTVGETLGASMSAHGWPGAERWAKHADRPGPALVGGSDRRGGGDLGPTGSKKAWESLGVNGNSLADDVPSADFPADALPKLTVRQAAMIQCIPEDWSIHGRKTAAYRQVGHAMPPPLAGVVGRAIADALPR